MYLLPTTAGGCDPNGVSVSLEELLSLDWGCVPGGPRRTPPWSVKRVFRPAQKSRETQLTRIR